MIVRVQGKDGTKRITVAPTDTLKDLKDKTALAFELSESGFSLSRVRNKADDRLGLMNVMLKVIPIQHGEMMFIVEHMSMDTPMVVGPSPTSSSTTPSSSHPSTPRQRVIVTEDDVDIQLAAMDGKIHRKKDPQMCRHGDNSKCINCVPLEPWDKAVQEGRDPPIKHLSFHCHLRKLLSGVDRGKFAVMEDLSCKIRPGCVDHPPWPAGICTKCQPSAITLNRQPYRHVDNVMFDDGAIVDRFIDGWRNTGNQRFGYLLGQYQAFTDVPLGIRAVVSAIYEPPQTSSQTSLELLEDSLEKEVDELAHLLGLRKVGWIFTDLEPELKGTVAYKRSVSTHILSAEECIMSADFQNKFPNPCKLSKTGYFGSKYVTICVSGDESNQISLKGYQVSNQCMALVRDDCLVPTLDAPELGYVRESTSVQYVPDVFYKTKDEYGEITKIARPLPLEYLIIELTTTTPLQPKPLLPGGKGRFPSTNLAAQDFSSLSTYLQQQQQSSVPFLHFMSDFHLLLFLYKADVLSINIRPHLPELCHAIREGNDQLGEQWRRKECWATVEQIWRTTLGSPMDTLPGPPDFSIPQKPQQASSHSYGTPTSNSSASSAAHGGGGWACQYCTYYNSANVKKCEVCDNADQ